MGQISLSLPSDGTTIEAADVNNPLNTILNEFNGNIDDNNIKTAAGINGTKLLANSIPPTALDANSRAGWRTGIMPAPNTITALGNRSYSLVFNTTDLTGYLSAGMRLRTTRTSAAPNQCTSLNGTTQYYSKSSPSAMTFTDDFTVSAWVKLTSYNGAVQTIVSRYNGTSGWDLQVQSTGQVVLIGYNAGAANASYVQSYQSIPLNKWVHVAAQLDMSAFTATTITSYVMLDGLDVPATVARTGTNPTALIQAGNLEIGGLSGGTLPFTGKIAQVAIYNAKVTQATILASMHQTLTGSESSLISAYSFNNTINDLNATSANNLTAQASAVATNADSPYGGQADGTISTTLDYGIITKTLFSTNTTLTVQLPEGCTIPTSGGVTAIAYSEHRTPYLFPGQRGKWQLEMINKAGASQASPVNGTWYNIGLFYITVPIGEWYGRYEASVAVSTNAAGATTFVTTLSTANNSESDPRMSQTFFANTSNVAFTDEFSRMRDYSLSAQTIYYLNEQYQGTNAGSLVLSGVTNTITFECAHL